MQTSTCQQRRKVIGSYRGNRFMYGHVNNHEKITINRATDLIIDGGITGKDTLKWKWNPEQSFQQGNEDKRYVGGGLKKIGEIEQPDERDLLLCRRQIWSRHRSPKFSQWDWTPMNMRTWSTFCSSQMSKVKVQLSGQELEQTIKNSYENRD